MLLLLFNVENHKEAHQILNRTISSLYIGAIQAVQQVRAQANRQSEQSFGKGKHVNNQMGGNNQMNNCVTPQQPPPPQMSRQPLPSPSMPSQSPVQMQSPPWNQFQPHPQQQPQQQQQQRFIRPMGKDFQAQLAADSKPMNNPQQQQQQMQMSIRPQQMQGQQIIVTNQQMGPKAGPIPVSLGDSSRFYSIKCFNFSFRFCPCEPPNVNPYHSLSLLHAL